MSAVLTYFPGVGVLSPPVARHHVVNRQVPVMGPGEVSIFAMQGSPSKPTKLLTGIHSLQRRIEGSEVLLGMVRVQLRRQMAELEILERDLINFLSPAEDPSDQRPG